MDYTFTEKETEMMFNWGYTSDFFEEICGTYKGVSYSLRIPGGNCIRFVDIDKDLCFDTKKAKYTDVVLEVSKMINKLKLKKREGK